MKLRKTRRIAPQGYIAIDRPSAKLAFEADLPVTIAGNNVNSYHIFSGWYLGCTIDRVRCDESFESIVRNFCWFLEPELGRYPVFYVQASEVQALPAKES